MKWGREGYAVLVGVSAQRGVAFGAASPGFEGLPKRISNGLKFISVLFLSLTCMGKKGGLSGHGVQPVFCFFSSELFSLSPALVVGCTILA